MAAFEKVCIVVKETPLQGLVRRYGTKSQAAFVMAPQRASFEAFDKFDRAYRSSVDQLQDRLPAGVRASVVDFQYLSTYQFDPHAAVLTIGPDGLVANVAKYLDHQPLIAINPDPSTIDGILARNTIGEAVTLLQEPHRVSEQALAMARVQLQDGQTLLAVNDLFIGQRTHVSARYEIEFRDYAERQSSSGIIISTGAGSTGWRRSVLTGAARVIEVEASLNAEYLAESYAFSPNSRELAFAVREPFISRASSADLVAGRIYEGESLLVTSQMPQNGVIFSDGIEQDFLEFNSGAVAHIGLAERSIRLWSLRTSDTYS